MLLLFHCRYRVAADRALEVRPSVVGTCEAVVISSQVFCPTSLIEILPVAGWTSKLEGFRNPSAQIAWLLPVVCALNGLSVGIELSLSILSLLPRVVLNFRVP